MTFMAPATSSDPDALISALRDYTDARTAALIEARRELGVNELDARALLFIAENPGTRPSELRDYLGITSAGITTLVDRLIHRDAVERQGDGNDRRVVRLVALVDFENEPWSALSRFDSRFRTAADTHDQAALDRAATVVRELTAATQP